MNKRMKQLAALLAVVVLVFASMNVSAFAAGAMADVTVEKNAQYVPIVFSSESDLITFVPVGETVQVPVGTVLMLDVMSTGNSYVSEFEYKVTNSQTGTKTYNGSDGFVLEAGSNTIKLVVKKIYEPDDSYEMPDHYVFYDELNDWNQSDVKQSAQLGLSDDGKVVENPTWSLLSMEDTANWKNHLFTLTPEGVLTAKEHLPAGYYNVLVQWEYDGKSEMSAVYLRTASRMEYGVALVQYSDTDGSFINGWFPGDEYMHSMDTTVAEALAKDKPMESLRKQFAMYGGYTLKEEYYDFAGNKVSPTSNRLVDDVGTLYVFFEKNGETYLVTGKNSGSTAPVVPAPAAPAEQVTTKAPKTGDSTPLALYLCLMVAGVVGIMVIRKRRA